MNPHALYIVEKSCRNTGGSHETIKLHMFLFNAHQHQFFSACPFNATRFWKTIACLTGL